MPIPSELIIFTNKLCSNQDGSRMVLDIDHLLYNSLDILWQDIENHHPNIIAADERIGRLVRELFNGFQQNNSRNENIKRYWQSFLYSIALRVAFRIRSNQGITLIEAQTICAVSIGRIDDFFKRGFSDASINRKLLSDLEKYAYKKIEYSSYARLSIERGDGLPPRSSNTGLIKKVSLNTIINALQQISRYEIEIERDITLCKTTIEYTRDRNVAINRLNKTHFDEIRNLYCTNRARFEYLREVNKDRSRNERLTFDGLNVIQRSTIDNLCHQLFSHLPSVDEKLDKIGAAIRSYLKRNRPLSLDRGGKSSSSPTDIPEDKNTSCLEDEENRELRDIVRSEMSIYYNGLKKSDRKIILYLRAHFGVIHDGLAHVINLDTSGVTKHFTGTKESGKIKRKEGIYEGIKKCIIKAVIDNNPSLSEQEIHQILNEMIDSEFGSNSEPESENIYYQKLAPLIEKYKAHFSYLRLITKKDRELARDLKGIKKCSYAKQFDFLAALLGQYYPGIKPELNTLSFLLLISRIQNILDQKINDPSDNLWK